MERTSLLTVLLLSDVANYPSLTLVNGLPDANSMVDYFKAVPFVTERASFTERTEDSPHGQLVTHSIQADIHRDATDYGDYANRRVMAYLETANGELLFVGSTSYPLSYEYERASGSGNSDERFSTLRMAVTMPV
jgi:hypothetical protein